MQFDLRKIRKAIAAGVTSAIAAVSGYLTAKAGVDPAIVGPAAIAVGAIAAKIVHLIPNEVDVNL
jgi:hypothetical protein